MVIEFHKTIISGILLTLVFFFSPTFSWGELPETITNANMAQLYDPALFDKYLSLVESAIITLEAEPASDRRFFIDSYAVRALTVAYDLTGDERFIQACMLWSDRMIGYQEKMHPPGAYYMNYNRKPGEPDGQWFVADSSSIAMGILATAQRSPKEARERYLASVRAFADLVLLKYVRPSGGVTDGVWEKSNDEWWCSTALFASLAFQLHGATGDVRYREVAIKAVDWLLVFNNEEATTPTFKQGAPSVLMYTLEAYSAALPYLEDGSARQKAVYTRFSQAVQWLAQKQNKEGWWDYGDWWGTKLGGLPFHLLIYLREVDDTSKRSEYHLTDTGDLQPFENFVAQVSVRAFRYIAGQSSEKAGLPQPSAFALFSFAEWFCPGGIYWIAGEEKVCPQLPETRIARLRQEATLLREKTAEASHPIGQLQNPGFETWDNGVPVVWLPRSGQKDAFKAAGIASAEGENGLVLPPNESDNYVWQKLYADGRQAGKMLRFSAMAKSFEPDRTRIVIKTNVSGTWESVRSSAHPGDGKWHLINAVFTFPENFPGGEIRIILNHGASKKACIFDDVKVAVVDS